MRGSFAVGRVVGLFCALVVAGAGLAACGSGGGAEGGSAGAAPEAGAASQSGAAALLPGRFADSKTLVAGVLSSGSSNMEHTTDSNEIVGFDPDIIKAIGEVLGLKVKVVPASFDSLIAGVQSGRYDVTLAEMADTKDRQESINFVDYITVGLGLVVKKGNPAGIEGIDDLCGRTVAVLTGGYPQNVAVPALSKECTNAGKPALRPMNFTELTQTVLAVQSGRADCFYNSISTVAYILKTTGDQFEQAGSSQTLARGGIGFSKSEPELGKALKAALQTLIKSGEYADIAKRWGLTEVMVPKATINQALI